MDMDRHTDPASFQSTMIEMDEEVAMDSHRELFNKLVASQSQPTIMIADNESGVNEHDYLQTLDYDTQRCSSAIEPNTYQLAKRPSQVATGKQYAQQTQQSQTRRCSSLSGPSSSSSSSGTTTVAERQHSLDYRNVCDLLPEDFKREPVVFSSFRNRWYTNEEVASILTNFNSHAEWQTNELQVRPKSGAVFLYSREKVRYRQDGYCWKKRKNGRTTREDHMKLKVQGVECIYGCYVHSAILPTFHRRCYWLLQNPDIVLVHYLNQPADDQNKMMIRFNSSSLEAFTRRSWTNEEIIEEIGSVFGGISQVKHMLNINVPPEVNSFFQQEQQQPQLEQQMHHQAATPTSQQQLLPAEQQQSIQNEELFVLPIEGESQLPQGGNMLVSANEGATCCGDALVELAPDDTTQHTTSSSGMDMLALTDSFGNQAAAQQPFPDDSLPDENNHEYGHQLDVQYPTHQIQMNLKTTEEVTQQQCQQDALSVDVGLQSQHHQHQLQPQQSFSATDADDDLLMNDFNLQTSSLGQVDEELVSNVIESLSNVEDLRDLLSGITGNEQQQQPIGGGGGGDTNVTTGGGGGGLLSQLDNDSIHDERSVDYLSSTTTTTTPTSSFDLYNSSYSYRPDQASSESSPYYDEHHQSHNNHQHYYQTNQHFQQQLETRSSLSDNSKIDNSLLIRPSPSAPVSRSNSTGNNVNYSSCNMSHISWSSYDSGTSP